MKVNVIPDIHGEVKWKKVIDESCDKIIFLGDYVDSFTVSNDQIITNLKDIISNGGTGGGAIMGKPVIVSPVNDCRQTRASPIAGSFISKLCFLMTALL